MTANALHELRLLAAAVALPVVAPLAYLALLWLLYRCDLPPEDDR